MDVRETIKEFLARGPYAVVGASVDRNKYGNKVLRCYMQHDLEVYPVNPARDEVEGRTSYPDLGSLPVPARAVSIITQPEVTERVVEGADAAGVELVWMQPGAESTVAVRRVEELGMKVIAGGPCLLVALGFRDI